MKKIIFSVLMILLFIGVSYTQTVQTWNFEGGYVIGIKWTDLDSSETFTSDWFDATLFDGKDVWVTAIFTSTSAVDSVGLLTLQGAYPQFTGETSSAVTAITIDTIATNSTTAHQTRLGVSDLAAVYSSTDTTDNVFNIPPVRVYPLWRISGSVAELTASSYDGILRIYIYGKDMDVPADKTLWKY